LKKKGKIEGRPSLLRSVVTAEHTT